MILSMTGFGRGTAERGGVIFTVEMAAVNHRFCEVVVKAPNALLAAERPLRQAVQSRLERGRVTVSVQLDQPKENGAVKFDADLATAYVERLRAFGQTLNLPDDLSLSGLLRIHHLWDAQGTECADDEMTAAAVEAATQALDALVAMREAEGETLARDLQARFDDLERMLGLVEERAPTVPEDYRARLESRVQQLRELVEVDEQRIAQEVIMYAERSDITEEIVRYRSHLEQARALMTSEEAVGRRLDFLCQEMNRETNTIGSKARDEEINMHVVELKAQLEKVREQVQNIE